MKGGQASNVYFGKYQQSSSGTQPTGTAGEDYIEDTSLTNKGKGPYYLIEPVKWRVLENSDNKLFLLADQNLDVQPYNTSEAYVTWATCSLRKWLNGTDSYENDNFIETAFSKEEQSSIATTSVTNTTRTPDTGLSTVIPAENTNDKIFLLSREEAESEAYFPEGDSDRVATETDYVSGHANMGNSSPGTQWWLRSVGADNTQADHVMQGGNISELGVSGVDVTARTQGVRPALNVDLSKVLFTSAAVGGKDNTADGSLTKINTTDSSDWKLTVKDTERNDFTAFATSETTNTVDYTDWTVNISYSGAQTGENEYVSVMLVDENNTVLYYGRVENITRDEDTSGQVSVTIPENLKVGEYTLKVFNEQYNGDKKTDYASELQEITLNVVKSSYTVTFETNGGKINSGEISSYNYGKETKLPTDVIKSGYTFAGWYDNKDFDGEAVTAISATDYGDKTFYAKWTQNSSGGGGGGGVVVPPTEPTDPTDPTEPTDPTDPTNPTTGCPKDETCPISKFDDSIPTAWYHDGVHYCLVEKLMVGISETEFAPDAILTRAELAQILYNKAGQPEVSGWSTFTDVPETEWYAKAIAWAQQNDVVEGIGNNLFAPDQIVTREQIAVMMHNEAGKPAVTGTLDFEDAADVSDWAYDAVLWATQNDVICGALLSDGTLLLNPREGATRAEAATLLENYYNR